VSGLKGVEQSVRDQAKAVEDQTKAVEKQAAATRQVLEHDGSDVAQTGLAVTALSAVVALFAMVAAWRSAQAAKSQADAANSQATQATAQTDQMKQQSKTLVDELEAARQGVASANAQLVLSLKSYRSTLRPFLLDVPHRLFIESTIDSTGAPVTRDLAEVEIDQNSVSICLTLPVRNVGAGTAEIRTAALRCGGKTINGRPLTTMLPPGEVAPIRVEVLAADEQLLKAGIFKLEVGYADIEGSIQPKCVLEFIWMNHRVILASP